MRLCIIPARGGSKRVFKKNIIPFFGKPIISYVIKIAIECGLFDVVMVSTDDNEIAEIAKKYGAEVPILRSEVNSGDHSTTAAVLLEVLNYYEEKNLKFENVCCIYPTSVLVYKNLLIKGLEEINKKKSSSVITLQRYKHPIQRAIKIVDENLNWNESQFEIFRTQDLEDFYFDCGQFYWLNVNDFLVEKKLLMEKTFGIVLSSFEAQDIDSMEDLELAKLKFLRMYPSLNIDKNLQ